MSKRVLVLVIFLSIALRVSLMFFGFHPDILVNTAWGEWLFRNGTIGFYDAGMWESWLIPTQPPLINLVYGLNYYIFDQHVLWFISYCAAVITKHNFFPELFTPLFYTLEWINSLYGETPHKWGALLVMKVLPIVADVALGLMFYAVGAGVRTRKAGIAFAALYLFSPFSWYLSSLWGQYDQITYLFALLAFAALLNKKTIYMSPVLLAISLGLKPTSLIFVPLYVGAYFMSKPSVKAVAVGATTSALLLFVSTYVFAAEGMLTFVREVLLTSIFEKSDHRLVNNAFNFWKVFAGERQISGEIAVLFLSAKVWGYLVFGLVNLGVLYYLYKKRATLETMASAMYLVSTSAFIFMTNMLERYYFAGVVSLLMVCIYKTRLLKYWMATSIIFWINLYKEWWYPPVLEPLKHALAANNYMLVRVLALANTLIFLRTAWLMLSGAKVASAQQKEAGSAFGRLLSKLRRPEVFFANWHRG